MKNGWPEEGVPTREFVFAHNIETGAKTIVIRASKDTGTCTLLRDDKEYMTHASTPWVLDKYRYEGKQSLKEFREAANG